MRKITFDTSSIATIAGLALVCAAACNNLVGLSDLAVAENAGGGGSSSATDGGKSSTSSTAGASSGNGGTEQGPSHGGDAPAGDAGAGGADDPIVIVGECTTNQQCIDKASADSPGAGGENGGVVPAVCIMPEGRCERLLSEDCDSVTGDYTSDRAIVIGSLFSTKGAQGATNLPRQQAAALAVEQINAIGGVPSGATAANARPLVMVSCDESTNLVRAAEHLVKDLGVPAIVGPNTSQDTLDVSSKVTVPGGTVVITPTAVASSITALKDTDLTWLMVPSDVQRAPLMISQINVIEEQLKAERSVSTIKLGIVFRNDALGVGTRTSLNDLVLNGKGLSDPINLGQHVSIDAYNAADADQQAIVSKYVELAPDIIVLAGTAEAITKVMVPLEAQWDTDNERPYYVLIDSTKVPELITAVTNNDDLRARVRGTGITPGPAGKNSPAEAYNGFKIDYDVRYAGGNATISGMGPAHDAAYAIGLALAATSDKPVSGKSIAAGLRKLAGGPAKFTTLATNLLPAFQKLTGGDAITAVGSFGVLDWDENGAVKGGVLEMWCIGGTSAKPAYQSSGLLFDIMSQQESGTYTQCGM
jgi:ABC-type branched-subunit amino acid transport system substrate-binding protein